MMESEDLMTEFTFAGYTFEMQTPGNCGCTFTFFTSVDQSELLIYEHDDEVAHFKLTDTGMLELRQLMYAKRVDFSLTSKTVIVSCTSVREEE
ncbi:MAG: hypothetical protein ACRC5C_03065, partial [Bacilli bacterium]